MELYTVSQVNQYLKDLLDGDPALQDLAVVGETSNFVRSAAGHVYFTLKDERAQIRCAFFRSFAGRGPSGLQDGMAVVAFGSVSLYEASGGLQLYVRGIQILDERGRLSLLFDQLRKRLAAEGLFDPARKRPLPAFPDRIGVVSSPTGAVIHDIRQILARRYPLAEIVLAPAQVQGEGAVASIVAALRALNEAPGIDVIVVARGGGSIEDLWPFNDESVARAIFASRVPVVSAVGHETDHTIADDVADVRAPTPSAAAELVAPDVADLRYRLDLLRRSLADTMADAIDERRALVGGVAGRLPRVAPDLAGRRQRVDDLAVAMGHHLEARLVLAREQLRSRCLQLQALSPLLTIGRGYGAIRRLPDRVLVRSAATVQRGDRLEIELADGSIVGEVETTWLKESGRR
ncbi:MAG: exodeoxyribonuclease VII large subunit [Chloroflexi bacterium]|nr:exodeoxyribonuclease VII large subunit [Chloroflexota bacterium]